MRTTIDIPDETYRRLKVKAAMEGRSLREIVLRGVDQALLDAKTVHKFEVPMIPSSRAEKLEITNEQIYDLIGFP
jgi:plasmid stability protein